MDPIGRDEFNTAITGIHSKLDIIHDTVKQQNSRVFKLEATTATLDKQISNIQVEHAVTAKVTNRLWAVGMTLLVPTIGAIAYAVKHIFWGG